MIDQSSISLNNKFSVKVVSQIDDLANLRDDWNKLATKHGSYMPFLCFDWFRLWLHHFLNGNELCVVLLYEGQNLACIAPFLRKRERFKGINVRKIELIGNVYSPFRYFLFDQLGDEQRIAYLSIILEFLAKSYIHWDIIELSGIPDENRSFEVLKKATNKTEFSHSEYSSFGDWYLDGINYSGDEYLKRRCGNIRKNVPYRIRRLGRIGDLEFKLIKDYNKIDTYMDIYYNLYSKSWQQKESVGPTFHRDLAKMAAKNGWLRIGFLFLDNSPMSCQFWISANQYAYILKLFYDQKYGKYAPGKILTAEMMKYVIDIDKVTTVDYVSGDDSYKKDWTPQKRERKGLLVFNDSIKGKYLALLTNKIQPAINKHKYLRKSKKIIKNILN
jgi:CelD/BcsL family acetyltransferase involved in cellulose biosynthesis